MPTHQGHDQTSQANQRREHRYSLKERDPARYEELDRMLAGSTLSPRRTRFVLFFLLAGVTAVVAFMLI